MGNQVKNNNHNYSLAIIVLISVIITIPACVTSKNNSNTETMSVRQKILKSVYPAFMWWGKLAGKNSTKLSHKKTTSPVSFYSLKSNLNDGSIFDFSLLKGKKVLLVNTASDCGYTNQYEDLQHLYEENKDKLVVIGFPANDFKEQEKGTDAEIGIFCRQNYGITFPLMKKTTVIKSKEQNDVFKWLTDSTRNGWNNKPPSWNFTKYLVDENGNLINYFGPSVSPASRAVKKAISK